MRCEAAETEQQLWFRPKLADALGVCADELQALIDDVVVVQSESSDRMNYVLEHPSSDDLVAAEKIAAIPVLAEQSVDRSDHRQERRAAP